jgi:hypothetical protein
MTFLGFTITRGVKVEAAPKTTIEEIEAWLNAAGPGSEVKLRSPFYGNVGCAVCDLQINRLGNSAFASGIACNSVGEAFKSTAKQLERIVKVGARG